MSFISADGFRLKIHIVLSAIHCNCLLAQVIFILRPILTTAKSPTYARAHLFVYTVQITEIRNLNSRYQLELEPRTSRNEFRCNSIIIP